MSDWLNLLFGVPELLDQWGKGDIDIFDKITELAKYFRCGEVVIARKALDCKKIGKSVYDQVVQTAAENFKRMKENKKIKADGRGDLLYLLDDWEI